MPKIVDHDQRRREICDAALALAAEAGLGGTSMRRVAARLDVSLGTVQHYFDGLDQLLEQTFQRIGERRTERVTSGLAALGHEPSPGEVLRASVLAGMPLDEPRRVESLAEVAFLGHWIGGHARAREGINELLGLFETLLRGADAAGDLAPGVDPVMEARTLWAIVSSQGVDLALGTATEGEALALVDHWFGRVFVDG